MTRDAGGTATAALWQPAAAPPSDDPVTRFAAVARDVRTGAQAVDEAAALPLADIAALHGAGLLAAVAPGGVDPLARDPARLAPLLAAVGAESLTLGRLYEGHVNAARLVEAYGAAAARRLFTAEAEAGRLLGVWNAERGGGPRLVRAAGGWRLTGRKVFCSGAGHIRRPVVTARDEADAVWMLLPDTAAPGVSLDCSEWRAAGMRGTATGTATFADVFVPDEAVLGGPGDYYRSPLFSGGAWRVLAVQWGGLKRIVELHAAALRDGSRADDPVQRARFARAAGALECARLLVAEAGRRAEGGQEEPAAVDAYVDGARAAFEELALTIVEAARRGVGLASFIAPHPLDRVIRDLETYLRQPFLDASRGNAGAWLIARGGSWA